MKVKSTIDDLDIEIQEAAVPASTRGSGEVMLD